eukprot:11023724-Alexandrium_andersonii.AAC.1
MRIPSAGPWRERPPRMWPSECGPRSRLDSGRRQDATHWVPPAPPVPSDANHWKTICLTWKRNGRWV